MHQDTQKISSLITLRLSQTQNPFHPQYLSEIRWSGTSLADGRSFDDVLNADEEIGTNKQNGGGISIVSW